jgi:hypothetical protein
MKKSARWRTKRIYPKELTVRCKGNEVKESIASMNGLNPILILDVA